MKFHLLKQGFVQTEVPQAVFDNLLTARETDLKVILYVIEKGSVDPIDISVKLNITLASVNSSLLFWCDKGLLLYEEDTAAPKRKTLLSAQEILKISGTVPEVGVLVNQLQHIYGKAINEKATNTFIALFLQENIPVDVILTVCMHLLPDGKGPAYAARVVQSWFSKYGITDGEKAERYIALLDIRQKRYAAVCEIFSLDESKLTTSEKTITDAWFERFNFGEDMVKCAAESAGENANIRYCNGILKSWSSKGYKTPKDTENEFSTVAVPKGKNIDDEDDLILQGMDIVPIFSKGE